MKFRALFVAILLILALSLSTVMAQDFTQYCGDLSESDCELLMSASTNMPESSNFTLTADFSITAEGETIAFDIEADGGYVADVAALEGVFDPEMAKDPMAVMEFMENLTLASLSEMVSTVVNSLDVELSITVNVPAEVSMGAVPESLTIDLWLVDGVGYVDLGAFSFADPSLTGIYGMDLNEVIGFAFSQITEEDFQAGLEMMFEGNPMMDSSGMDMFMDPDFISEFMTMERVEDSEVDGTAVAVFEATIDYGALFASEAFGEVMAEAMMDEEMPEGFDEEMMMESLAEAFGDSTAVVTYYVGIDDGYMYGFTFEADFTIDPAAFEEMSGEESMTTEPIVMTMNMEFMRSNVNAVESISAPEGATIVTLEELMAGPSDS